MRGKTLLNPLQQTEHPGHDKPLSLKQRLFVQKVIETKTPTQAAREVYKTRTDGSARSIACYNMKKPKVKEAIEKALKLNNLTEQRLTGVIDEAIKTPSPETIDWNVKHTFVQTALKLKGYLNNQQNNNNTQVNIGIGLDNDV